MNKLYALACAVYYFAVNQNPYNKPSSETILKLADDFLSWLKKK